MNCPNCKAEIPEDASVCGACGYNIKEDDCFEAVDKAVPVPDKKAEKVKSSKGSGKKQGRVKIILVIAALIVIALVILYVVSLFTSSEGIKLLRNIPLGRDISYAESEAKIDFSTLSQYNGIKSIGAFDYIYEAEGTLKVEGIKLPEWAVFVSVSADKAIDRVTYYDFAQLQRSWKGHKSSAEISTGLITYGMTEKTVERTMGFKPYSVILSLDNSSTYVYRYYYCDELTGDDVVVNYFVVLDDVGGKVKNVYSSEIPFTSFMMSVN